ncbi:sulfatase-like hydrolase/transferase [Chelativorans sp.]|uniref:sulfatase-like hydrolase/transferase n=1 Tax=Chelativorans sp. TaxID=2203393 RepID=UPI002811BE9C|nr:sulfatase-like hydrolase/transferase [Chelativorans sp.]
MTGKKPNVIVVLTDQQRWDTVGAHGNPMGLTPNFDRLAQSGAFIKNSFTCQPVCAPARSAFQTGLYPTTSGCYKNGIPLPRTLPTLATLFGDAGYATGYIGKWHLAENEPVPPEERGGYQDWLAANLLEFVSGPFDTVLFDESGHRQKLPGYRVDALADAAIRYIDRRQDRPFFLFLSFLEPHHQNSTDSYPAPLGYEESLRDKLVVPTDLAQLGGSTLEHLPGYLGMVKRLDEALGRIIEALHSLGILNDTIVLFTSDHGCHFKTRNDEYKRSSHEASIRVPTLFHGPAFDGLGTYDGLVSLIDLPPTLLDAAGVTVPAAMQGKSLLPALRGERKGREGVLIQISEHHVGRALRTARWKYEVEAPELDGYAVPGAQVYVEARLYDLHSDPHELENLIRSRAHSGIREELRSLLAAAMAEAGEAAPKIVTVEDAGWQERMASRTLQRTILATSI